MKKYCVVRTTNRTPKDKSCCCSSEIFWSGCDKDKADRIACELNHSVLSGEREIFGTEFKVIEKDPSKKDAKTEKPSTGEILKDLNKEAKKEAPSKSSVNSTL